MSAIVILLIASISVAAIFLAAFIWSVRNGQFDDDFSPPQRILFDNALEEAPIVLVQEDRSFLPAYDWCLKASHAFNVLDARGAISVSQRAGMILQIRKLACAVAERYVGGVAADTEGAAAEGTARA